MAKTKTPTECPHCSYKLSSEITENMDKYLSNVIVCPTCNRTHKGELRCKYCHKAIENETVVDWQSIESKGGDTVASIRLAPFHKEGNCGFKYQ